MPHTPKPGTKFGHNIFRRVATSEEADSNSEPYWVLECERCGGSTIKRACNVRNGNVKSCGLRGCRPDGQLPPQDLLPITTAGKVCGASYETVRKLITAGQIKAYPSTGQCGSRRGTHPCKQVSVARLAAILLARGTRTNLKPTNAPPPDSEPIYILAKIFKVTPQTLQRWCELEVHPALGRKVSSGVGPCIVEAKNGERRRWRGLLMSRADAQVCVDAHRDPTFREIPGNPGMWISAQRTDGHIKAIFKHDDGRLFFSAAIVGQRLQIAPTYLSQSCYREKLEKLQLAFPGPHGSGLRGKPGQLNAFSEASVDGLALHRSGKQSDGCWLTTNELWNDNEGNWFSSIMIARQMGIELVGLANLRRDGYLTRFKRVPRDPGGQVRARGGSIMVHHESEVLPLLGRPGTASGPALETGGKAATKPANEMHSRWKAWRLAGQSYGQIVDSEKRETGRIVTRDAVKKAVKRAKPS